MDKTRGAYISSCEVSEIAEVTLGGYSQKIAIEGKSKSLPVVITLHGGPGSPVPFSVGCRGLFPEWTDAAVMVYWDQLGCGINNAAVDNLNTEAFVDMTVDLVGEIKKRFPENKLYLFGISWGSVLALKTAVRVPELLNGVLVYGQVLKNLFFNDEVLSAFESAPKGKKLAVHNIIKTNTDCEYKVLDANMKKLYKLLKKHTNAYTNKNSKPLAVGKIVKGLIASPDYTFKDFKAIVNNGYRQNEILWRELLEADLTDELSKVRVKYLLLQGDTDIITSTKFLLSEDFGNENVTVRVIKNSGHIPSAAAMEECIETLKQFIR